VFGARLLGLAVVDVADGREVGVGHLSAMGEEGEIDRSREALSLS
jgi:hypothetical protein